MKQNLAVFPPLSAQRFSLSSRLAPAPAAADTTADTQAGGALATDFRDAAVAEQSQASGLI